MICVDLALTNGSVLAGSIQQSESLWLVKVVADVSLAREMEKKANIRIDLKRKYSFILPDFYLLR